MDWVELGMLDRGPTVACVMSGPSADRLACLDRRPCQPAAPLRPRSQEGDTDDDEDDDGDFAPTATVDEVADDVIDDDADADADEVVIPPGAGEVSAPGVEEPEEDQPRAKRRRVTSGGSD